MRATSAAVFVAVPALIVASMTTAARADGGTVTSTAPPAISGTSTYGHRLGASGGAWSPSDVTLTYQWLRDGHDVAGATARTYALTTADLGHRMSVEVTATDTAGDTGEATSAPTGPVQRATLTVTKRPSVVGTARFFHTVHADGGTWSHRPTRVRYQWLRDGRPIAGATQRRYTYAPGDVGHVVRVEATATAPGYTTATSTSPRAGRVRDRVDVRRTVTYSVATRGHVTASVATFKRLAQQTYDDPRGWRAKGIRFVRVRHGGGFTLVLAQASTLPSFSSGCSAQYSCRVGRFVVINQDRWLHASPAWTSHHGTLRSYRDLVVNHETGHWLGYHHELCPGPGRLAPVMQQQSKGLHGCRINAWPTVKELDGRPSSL